MLYINNFYNVAYYIILNSFRTAVNERKQWLIHQKLMSKLRSVGWTYSVYCAYSDFSVCLINSTNAYTFQMCADSGRISRLGTR